MRKASSLDYIFGVGKIRALENFLIRSEVFEEAIGESLDEALRLFAESDLYSEELSRVKNSPQLESVLSQETANLKKAIRGLILDEELLCLLETSDLTRVCQVCSNFRSEFLRDYMMHLVDMHNIKSFLRLYILQEPQERLKETLACAGFIKREDFLELYSKDLAAFLNRMEFVHTHYGIADYTYDLGEAIQKTINEDSFVFLEKAMNDFLIKVLRQAKYINFGPEPVVAYYFAKRNEINLIRMIILGKMNNVPAALLKERLNEVYA